MSPILDPRGDWSLIPLVQRVERPKVERVYDFIVAYKKSHDGNSPTFREIMEDCEVLSTSTVVYYLDKLGKRGLIRRPEPRIGSRYATMIEVVGGQWTKTEKETK